MSQTINDFTVKTLIDSELIEQKMQCKEWLYQLWQNVDSRRY